MKIVYFSLWDVGVLQGELIISKGPINGKGACNSAMAYPVWLCYYLG